MTFQDFGSLGDAVGGIAVIISLLYVAVQIKQNTKAVTAATSQAFIAGFQEVASCLLNSEFSKTYVRGLKGLASLQDHEKVGFVIFCINSFRLWESYYYQRKDDVFDARIWTGFTSQLHDLFSYQGVMEVWAIRKHQFSEEFQQFVETINKNRSEHSTYNLG